MTTLAINDQGDWYELDTEGHPTDVIWVNESVFATAN
jgi:hypothetical protein